MPAISGIHFTAEEYEALMAPTLPAPEFTREQQLEHALDAVLLPVVERVLDRNMLDELCAASPVAAERLIEFLIRDLEWHRDRLRPRAPAQ